MDQFRTLLEEGLIEEVENIPEDRFDFRPTPEVKSVSELIQHILEVALMMTGELTRPDTDFGRAPWPELLDLYAGDLRRTTDKAGLLKLPGPTGSPRRRSSTCCSSSDASTASPVPGSPGCSTGSPRRCTTADRSSPTSG